MSISVIIPALNEAQRIEQCIASVRAQPEVAEIIVVDGGSTDDTVQRARRLATVLVSARGRAAQMNAGARAAAGDVYLFLHADSHLHANAFAAMNAALSDAAVVGGTFTLRFDTDGTLLDLYALCTRLPLRVFRYGDQGVFVRQAVFATLGGYRAMPIMEDVDFIARLRGAGHTALVHTPVTTSARRFTRLGVIRQQLLNTALVGLYSCGVSPERLAHWYENVHR